MERLTITDVRVDEHTTRRTVIDARAVREHAMDFYWRLKAYEDTGLMPDEIKSMQGEHFSGLEMAKLHSALMELKKYQEADKDGRVVVHGRWEPCFDEDNNWRRGFTKCSNCGKEYYASVVQHYKYCCFCGAKMDGDANG